MYQYTAYSRLLLRLPALVPRHNTNSVRTVISNLPRYRLLQGIFVRSRTPADENKRCTETGTRVRASTRTHGDVRRIHKKAANQRGAGVARASIDRPRQHDRRRPRANLGWECGPHSHTQHPLLPYKMVAIWVTHYEKRLWPVSPWRQTKIDRTLASNCSQPLRLLMPQKIRRLAGL